MRAEKVKDDLYKVFKKHTRAHAESLNRLKLHNTSLHVKNEERIFKERFVVLYPLNV